MAELLNINRLVSLFETLNEDIESEIQLLSELDSKIGDGDHGVALFNAIRAINHSFKKSNSISSDMFYEAGFAVMNECGGSTSTIIGSWLIGMGDGIDKEEISSDGLVEIFKKGLIKVQENTSAKLGDKTIMDALIPATIALEENKDKDLIEMFKAASFAAKEGAERTRNMCAKFGRARYSQNAGYGFIDPGAMSIAIIFNSFADQITRSFNAF